MRPTTTNPGEYASVERPNEKRSQSAPAGNGSPERSQQDPRGNQDPRGEQDRDDYRSDPKEVHSLHDVLDRVESSAEDREKVSLGQVLDALGQHSFAPLILISGLIMLAPGPADIPGVPVVIGLFVALVAIQPLLGREHIWVPQWMERRELGSQRVQKMVSWLRRPAGWLDRLTKRRYTSLVNHAGVLTIAVACILIAASTPILEFVPFSANLAGGAITAFALALLAKDGLVAGIAILLSLGTVGLVLYQFIGG